MVASGKGGVGKSTVAGKIFSINSLQPSPCLIRFDLFFIVNVAVALKTLHPQKEIGLLDADVFGPSIPLMMNVNETPLITDGNKRMDTLLLHLFDKLLMSRQIFR